MASDNSGIEQVNNSLNPELSLEGIETDTDNFTVDNTTNNISANGHVSQSNVLNESNGNADDSNYMPTTSAGSSIADVNTRSKSKSRDITPIRRKHCYNDNGVIKVPKEYRHLSPDQYEILYARKIPTSMEVLDDAVFVPLVREHPELWKRAGPDAEYFKNEVSLAVRNRIWEGIALEVQCSVEKVKNRWKNLYDSFRRAYKAELNGSGRGGTYHKRQSLSFLLEDCDAFFASRQNNKSPSSDGEQSDGIYLDPFQALKQPTTTGGYGHGNGLSILEQQLVNLRKRKQEIQNGTFNMELRKKSNVNSCATIEHNDEDDDEDMLFARSIAKYLKRLPDMKRDAAKIRLHQVLFDIMYNE